MLESLRTTSGVVWLSVLVGLFWWNQPSLPPAAPWRTLQDIWTPKELDRLIHMVERVSSYTTFIQDFTAEVENIGEGQPIGKDGTCTHPFLVPSPSQPNLCILPSRLDIGRHFLLTGGYSNHRESYARLVSRAQTFYSHTFDKKLEALPEFKSLFESPKYKQAASAICAAQGKPVFDPIQLGIILQLPGQEVPAHYDIPWFYGATRFHLPQWLLVVMEQSGLFQDIRVPQIQGVAYLHPWDHRTIQGGGFYFLPQGKEGPIHVIPPATNTAIVLDGSVIVHGTVTYRPDSPKTLPLLKKGNKYRLERLLHASNTTIAANPTNWALYEGNGAPPLALYQTEDFRICLVWRARCFASEAEKELWASYSTKLTVPEVLDALWADVKKRKGWNDATPLPAPLDLALLLLDEYVEYPKRKPTLLSYNYCLASMAMPYWLGRIWESVMRCGS